MSHMTRAHFCNTGGGGSRVLHTAVGGPPTTRPRENEALLLSE